MELYRKTWSPLGNMLGISWDLASNETLVRIFHHIALKVRTNGWGLGYLCVKISSRVDSEADGEHRKT